MYHSPEVCRMNRKDDKGTVIVFFMVGLDMPLESINSEKIQLLKNRKEIIDIYETAGVHDILMKAKLDTMAEIPKIVGLIRSIGHVRTLSTVVSSMTVKENGTLCAPK